jgi:hypothetical protein
MFEYWLEVVQLNGTCIFTAEEGTRQSTVYALLAREE